MSDSPWLPRAERAAPPGPGAEPGSVTMEMISRPETIDAAVALGSGIGYDATFSLVIGARGLEVWNTNTDGPALGIDYRSVTAAQVTVIARMFATPEPISDELYPAAVELVVDGVVLPLAPVGGDEVIDLLVAELDSRTELPWTEGSEVEY
jgi:hypothetical protein